jgi:hypothetical protein
MAARKKPCWVVLDGGPLDGERSIVHPDPADNALVLFYEDHAPTSTRTPHEYRVTRGYLPGATKARVAAFVRTLPDEPIPPPRFAETYSVFRTPKKGA